MKLKEWRDANNLKMIPAAKKLGLSQPTISRIEDGSVFPSFKTIEKIRIKTKGAVTAADLISPEQRELLTRLAEEFAQ